MNIVLISRSKGNKEYPKDFIELFKQKVVKKYLLATDVQTEFSEHDLLVSDDSKGKNRSTGTHALNVLFNKVISESDKVDAILSVSKEISIDAETVKGLADALDDNTLVVGYRFRMSNIKLDEHLQSFYRRKGIAYLLPWNTCCLWNLARVEEIIESTGNDFFDEICDENDLGQLLVKVDGADVSTEYRGMEEGLALAKSFSVDPSLKTILLGKQLLWNVKIDKLVGHKSKIARKDIVLSTLLNIKGYSPELLRLGCKFN